MAPIINALKRLRPISPSIELQGIALSGENGPHNPNLSVIFAAALADSG